MRKLKKNLYKELVSKFFRVNNVSITKDFLEYFIQTVLNAVQIQKLFFSCKMAVRQQI